VKYGKGEPKADNILSLEVGGYTIRICTIIVVIIRYTHMR